MSAYYPEAMLSAIWKFDKINGNIRIKPYGNGRIRYGKAKAIPRQSQMAIPRYWRGHAKPWSLWYRQ